MAAPTEDERAANLEPLKLAAAVNLRAMNPEPMTPAGEFLLPGCRTVRIHVNFQSIFPDLLSRSSQNAVKKKPTPVVIHRTDPEPARTSPGNFVANFPREIRNAICIS